MPEETLVYLVLMETPDHAEKPDYRDTPVIRVPSETQGLWVAPEQEGRPAGREVLARKATEVTTENWESQEILEDLAQMEERVIQDQPDHRVLPDLADPRV